MAGSRSRGTARSIRKSGRPFRAGNAHSTCARVRTQPGALADETLRELLGALLGAVGDGRDRRAARDEIPDRQLADLARADDEYAAPLEIPEHLLGERRRSR